MDKVVIVSAFPCTGGQHVVAAVEALCEEKSRVWMGSSENGLWHTSTVPARELTKEKGRLVVSVARNFGDTLVDLLIEKKETDVFVKSFAAKHGLEGNAEFLNVFIEANGQWVHDLFFEWKRFNKCLVARQHCRVNFDSLLKDKRAVVEQLANFLGAGQNMTLANHAITDLPTTSFRTILDNPAIAKLERIQRSN